jgi:hypothetical protein
MRGCRECQIRRNFLQFSPFSREGITLPTITKTKGAKMQGTWGVYFTPIRVENAFIAFKILTSRSMVGH